MKTATVVLMCLLTACEFMEQTAKDRAAYEASKIYLDREVLMISASEVDHYACRYSVLVCERYSARQMRCRCT